MSKAKTALDLAGELEQYEAQGNRRVEVGSLMFTLRAIPADAPEQIAALESRREMAQREAIMAERNLRLAQDEVAKVRDAMFKEREVTQRAFRDLASMVGPREAGWADTWSSVELLVKERDAAREQAEGLATRIKNACHVNSGGYKAAEHIQELLERALADYRKANPEKAAYDPTIDPADAVCICCGARFGVPEGGETRRCPECARKLGDL